MNITFMAGWGCFKEEDLLVLPGDVNEMKALVRCVTFAGWWGFVPAVPPLEMGRQSRSHGQGA
jgi:hypothetical protein